MYSFHTNSPTKAAALADAIAELDKISNVGTIYGRDRALHGAVLESVVNNLADDETRNVVLHVTGNLVQDEAGVIHTAVGVDARLMPR